MLSKILIADRSTSFDSALSVLRDPWLARVLSNRLEECEDLERVCAIISPDLSRLFPDLSLYGDMDKAASRLASAIASGEKVVCAVDFDSDGINSGAIFHRAMNEVFWCPRDSFDVQISHRSQWGYGYTEFAVRNIFRKHDQALPDLVITADQGSSNEEQVKLTYQLARERGKKIEVIVTDHHEIPGDGPVSAYAFVNPQKDDIPQDMKDICGATVLWFLMVRTYQLLEERGHPLPPHSKRKLFELIAHCSIATISDVMSLASPLNRAICKAGFAAINTLNHPAWEVLRNQVGNESVVDEETIGFVLAPQINAASRIGLSGETALAFLTTQDPVCAKESYDHLVACNEERKEIGAEMLEASMEAAKQQVGEGRLVIVVYLPDGTPGVSGIIAGRLKEAFNRPAIMMSPSSESEATGSARSIPGINIRECLQEVHESDPALLPKFGGHPMAAGMTVPIHLIDRFAEELNKAIRKRIDIEDMAPVIKADFHLNLLRRPMGVEHAKRLETLKPYGQKFPPPVACVSGKVEGLRPMGKKRQVHLRFSVRTEDAGHLYNMVWFNARESDSDPWPVSEGVVYTFAAIPSINRFRGQETLQLQVLTLGTLLQQSKGEERD